MEKQLKLFFEFLENDKKLSDNTLQSYKRDIKQFKEYLNQKGKDYSNITSRPTAPEFCAYTTMNHTVPIA